MGYYSYYLMPNHGYTLEEACEEQSERTALIYEVRGGVPTGITFPCTPINKAKLKPSFPPEYYARKQRIIQRNSVQVLEKPLFEDKLANGANPFFQLILIAISKADKEGEGVFGLTTDEVIRYLIEHIRVLPNTVSSVKHVKTLLTYMNNQAYILKKGSRWARGLMLKGGDMMIDWKKGYNPVMYQIVTFVKGNGMTSRDEIHDYIIDYLGWLKRRKVIDHYLNELVRTGVLKANHKNWFSYVKPLTPYIAEKDTA